MKTKEDAKITNWFLIKDDIFVTVTHNRNVCVMPYDEWCRIRKIKQRSMK